MIGKGHSAMNERIEELAYQSGIALGNNYAEGSRRDLLEKFAELIVKQCLSYMKEGDIDYAKWMIKKEFGVDE